MNKLNLISNPDIFEPPSKKPRLINLGNKSKNKKKKNRHIIKISTDGSIIYNGKHHVSIEKFMYDNKDSVNLHFVLTDRELSMIKEFSVRFNVKLYSLESYYPFFSDIKFNSDVKVNLDCLNKYLHYAKSFGFKNGSFSSVVTQGLRKTLLNKHHTKSEYDSKFYFSYAGPYQEVFKFNEKRKNRTVVSLDFNSMFASCLQGDFINPKKLTYVPINTEYDGQELSQGIYKVTLKKPKSSFIKNYHLFKVTKNFKKYAFSLSADIEIEATLHKEEIEYYHKHFSSIWINSGYVSKDCIGHPLYKKSIELYKKRLNSKKLGNKSLEKKYKLELAMLHSITNSKSYKKKAFKSLNDVSTFLRKEFGVELDFSNEFSVKNFFKSNHFFLFSNSKGFKLQYIDIYSKVSIYSLSSQVMAKVRIKMLTLLEELLNLGDIDICYINTDCVHFSFPKDFEELFWHKTKHLIGDGLGQLKVETVADSGYWFGVGQYFLYSNGKVVNFSNAGLNHRGNTNPFLLSKSMIMHYKSSNFSHITKIYSHFPNLLSYNKKLDSEYNRFTRFTTDQVLNSCSSKSLEEVEKESSSGFKIKTYLSLLKSNQS